MDADALSRENADLKARLAEVQEANRRLEDILRMSQRENFGRRSEKLSPTSSACPCGCGEMARIGEDVSERLDVIPAQFQVLVTQRPIYACRRCLQAVAQAHAPGHVVPGGLPSERLIASIIVSTFGDFLPFYRQAGIFERQGLHLDRGTLGNWTGRACFHLIPVIDHMRAHLHGANRIFVDETRAPVLDPGRKATWSGYFWAVLSDDRGHGGADPPIVLFHYAPGRGKEHPLEFLAGYRGRFLQATPASPAPR